MITENLSTLKMHKLTKAQYERELAAGRIDENALYLTPDDDGNSSCNRIKSYTSLDQLGLDSSATLDDIIMALDDSVLQYWCDRLQSLLYRCPISNGFLRIETFSNWHARILVTAGEADGAVAYECWAYDIGGGYATTEWKDCLGDNTSSDSGGDFNPGESNTNESLPIVFTEEGYPSYSSKVNINPHFGDIYLEEELRCEYVTADKLRLAETSSSNIKVYGENGQVPITNGSKTYWGYVSGEGYLDTEYLTTDMYNGQPVYTKIINLGDVSTNVNSSNVGGEALPEFDWTTDDEAKQIVWADAWFGNYYSSGYYNYVKPYYGFVIEDSGAETSIMYNEKNIDDIDYCNLFLKIKYIYV